MAKFQTTDKPPLPQALTLLSRLPNWICWKPVLRNGKWNKPPISPRTGCKIDITDASNWVSYAEARAAAIGDWGLGFALLDSGIGALDCDDCRNARTGRLDPWAQELIERADSYAEVTPSQQGVRIIGTTSSGIHVHCSLPRGRGKVEIYREAARFITISGDQIAGGNELTNIDHLIDALVPANGNRPHQEVDRTRSPLTVEQIISKHKLNSNLRHYILHGEPCFPKRSAVFWKVANELSERHPDMTVDEAYVLMRHSRWSDKYKDASVWDQLGKIEWGE